MGLFASLLLITINRVSCVSPTGDESCVVNGDLRGQDGVGGGAGGAGSESTVSGPAV